MARSPSAFNSISQVHEPIDGSDHDSAPNDIADGHREEVGKEKVFPGQGGKVGSRFADRRPEGTRRATLDEQPDRKVIDIRDAMLESSRNESGDGQNDRENSVGGAARAV